MRPIKHPPTPTPPAAPSLTPKAARSHNYTAVPTEPAHKFNLLSVISCMLCSGGGAREKKGGGKKKKNRSIKNSISDGSRALFVIHERNGDK